ncbi:MAG: hypothetical protein JNN18_14385 [Rubrivivax sp.]|jgi:hypothetical protein|nr:hypothetical protein [Rubrivivax sp.]
MYKASLVANREFSSLTASQRKQIVKFRDELEAMVGDCLAAGRETGEFQFEDLSMTRMAVVSLCRSTLLWHSPRGRLTPEAIGDYYVELVLEMVGRQAAPRTQSSRRSALASVAQRSHESRVRRPPLRSPAGHGTPHPSSSRTFTVRPFTLVLPSPASTSRATLRSTAT